MAQKKEVQASISIDTKKYVEGMKKASKTTKEEGKKIEDSSKKVENASKNEADTVERSNKRISSSSKVLTPSVISNNKSMADSNKDLGDTAKVTAEKVEEANKKMSDSMKDVEKGTVDFKKAFEDAGQKIVDTGKMVSDAGSLLTKTVTLPIVGATGAVLKLGTEYEKAHNTIRIGTGATGEALEGLKKEFDEVYGSVTHNMDDVAMAIADLNTRTGQTGDDLENLARTMLNLSKITGEDLGGLIKDTTRLFGDWGVETKDQTKMLDTLFKVSQSTGIGVSDLANKATAMGTRFRNAGFNLDDTLSLLGSFEKTGVNTELALSSINIALNKIVEDGAPDAKKKFQEVIKEIQNMKDEAKAMEKAKEYFGARAWGDMFDTIRAGKFDVEALTKSIQESGETVNGLEEETRTFKDELSLMWKEVSLALKPMGEDMVKILDEVKPFIMDIVEGIKKLVNWFTELEPGQKKAVLGFVAFMAILGPILSVIGKIITVFGMLTLALSGPLGGVLGGIATFITGTVLPAIGALFGALGTAVTAIGLPWILAGIAIVGVGYLIVKNWDFIKESLNKFSDYIGEKVSGIVEWFSNGWENIKNKTNEIFDKVVGGISEKIDKAKEKVRNAIDAIKGFFDFEWKLPRIKVPKFNIIGKFDLMPPDISFPKIDVSWHAKGGIFTQPTLFNTPGGVHGVGEAGPEAILPLNKLPGLLGLDKKGNGDMNFNFYDTNINGYNDLEQLSKELGMLMRRRTV